jgi:hypothetical protein
MATAPKFRIDVDIHNLLMDSSRQFRPDFFNSLPRGPSRRRPGWNLPPSLARCRPELVTALETAYAVRMKEIG